MDSQLIVLRTPQEEREDAERKLAGFRMIDDTYARSFFKRQPELAQFVLRIITELDDLEIDLTEYETQYDIKRLLGARSFIFDVHGGDRKGRKYDLEMEKSDSSPARTEVHMGAMITEHLDEGDPFSKLPELYVIFICEHDEVGNGRPVNEFMYMNTDRFRGSPELEDRIKAHELMGGRTHILKVNGDYEDNGTDIGKLIHDFKCDKADDMYFDNLAKRTRELKETQEGVDTVCKAMEAEREVSNKEVKLKILLNLMYNRKWSAEEAMDAMGITEDRDLYARSARYAIEKHGTSLHAML